MDQTTHFQIRSARDRLIDLLGVGETYPLADLPLRDDQLTVAFTNTAKIPIEDAQPWVVYELHDPNNQPVERDGKHCQISLLFLVSDFTDLSTLAQRLGAHSDPPSAWVWRLFSPEVKRALEDSKLASGAVVRGLNTLIGGIAIYEDLLREGVTPSAEARELASKNPYGAQLVLLNRLILEDAYPKELINRRRFFQTKGNGVTLILETPALREDVTYSVLARKYLSDKGVRLQQRAPIKVGLDKSLSAEILEAPLLNPAVDGRPPTEPRIVHHGASVKVKIRKSQEGVDYRLVYFRPDQPAKEVKLSDGADLRGNLHDIVLSTQPIFEDEDIDIRIRVTKTFDPSERRKPLADLLDVVLPLKIRAKRSLQVSVEPRAIVDYQEDGSVKIAGTQKSVKYRLYFCAIADRDFVHSNDAGFEVLKVNQPGEPEVRIRKPVKTDLWLEPRGYKPLGDPQSGNGGELKFTLKALTDETLIIIQALKEHQTGKADPGPKVALSALQLDQVVAVLVRPNPAPELILRVPVNGGKTDGTIQVLKGQPGVFYFFRQTPKGQEFPRPAYIHQRDDRDGSLNKGLGQLAVEIDLVVARDPAVNGEGGSAHPANLAPEPPLLETGPLDTNSTLYIRALKAQTQISTQLVDAPQIGLLPEIRLEQATVDAGSEARVLVMVSKPDEKYQVMLKGKPVKRALNGNGKDLVFLTDSLVKDTTFEVVVTRPADKGILVERVVQVQAHVNPK